ncbi:MAG: hypothetical protein V4819_09230 [Verrucomicrobiota bacterium]
MDEAPAVPQPVPAILRGAVWIACSIPPVATLAGNLIASFFRSPGDYGVVFLTVPVVVFFIIGGLVPLINLAVRTRYRGRSLVFLNCAYILGQIIVCLALWFGSCFLYMS